MSRGAWPAVALYLFEQEHISGESLTNRTKENASIIGNTKIRRRCNHRNTNGTSSLKSVRRNPSGLDTPEVRWDFVNPHDRQANILPKKDEPEKKDSGDDDISVELTGGLIFDLSEGLLIWAAQLHILCAENSNF